MRHTNTWSTSAKGLMGMFQNYILQNNKIYLIQNKESFLQ